VPQDITLEEIYLFLALSLKMGHDQHDIERALSLGTRCATPHSILV
jgi:hypothetical protein